MRRHVIAASCALFIIVSLTPDAQAQSAYPTKSIRFIVPVTTGGPSDIVARLLGDKLAASLGKPVIVDMILRAGAACSCRPARRARSCRS